MQLTLISLYGQKQPELKTLTEKCQKLVTDTIGSAFEAYKIPQVHATIIGLKRSIDAPVYNANFTKHRGMIPQWTLMVS